MAVIEEGDCVVASNRGGELDDKLVGALAIDGRTSEVLALGQREKAAERATEEDGRDQERKERDSPSKAPQKGRNKKVTSGEKKIKSGKGE